MANPAVTGMSAVAAQVTHLGITSPLVLKEVIIGRAQQDHRAADIQPWDCNY